MYLKNSNSIVSINSVHSMMFSAKSCGNSNMSPLLHRNFSFNDVNAVGAKRIARIAREMGVKRLIHMSHLNAQPNPPAHISKTGSNYLISKVSPYLLRKYIVY